MNADRFNNRYTNLIEECIDEIFYLVRKNDVGKITFNEENNVAAPYANIIMSSEDYDLERPVRSIEYTKNGGADDIIAIICDDCTGYINTYYSEDVTAESLFDIYRAINEVVDSGNYQRLIRYE